MTREELKLAKKHLENNELVVIPTETVYGLAANALNPDAIRKIYALKKRPSNNPLIVHVHNWNEVEKIAKNIPEKAKTLATHFWPGPLTLILEKRSIIPDEASGGLPTVGVRIPDHPLTLELLRKLNFPLVAPSANPYTRVSPTSVDHVRSYYGERSPFILDGGPCAKGIESTIVSFDGDQVTIYRKGSITKSAIEEVIGSVQVFTNEISRPLAPGMVRKHYSPLTKTILTNDVLMEINQHANCTIGLLSYQTSYESSHIASVRILSPDGKLEEAAKNLYAYMHQLDQEKLDLLIIERLPEEGLGSAINDKLERAIN